MESIKIIIIGTKSSGKTTLSGMIYNLLKKEHNVNIHDENGKIDFKRLHDEHENKLEKRANINIRVFEPEYVSIENI